MKVVIIGAGAAGMTAAIEAAKNGHEVTLLERQSRVGRKLMATGNGRCNLTNRNAGPDRYHGDSRLADKVLHRYSVADTLEWFRRLGLYTVEEEDGRFYPLSDHASSVVDTLRVALAHYKVEPVCGCEAVSVKKKARGYTVTAADGTSYYGDKLIVTAGGCAGAGLGGTKSGYALLASLGHKVTAVTPSLVQLKTDTALVRGLKGIRADGKLSLKAPGGVIAQSQGEVQFTEFGVSGPGVFELSRAVSVTEERLTLLIDFLRQKSEEEISCALRERMAQFPELKGETLLTGMLHPRLALAVLKASGVAAEETVSPETAEKIAHTVKYFPLAVTGTLGMDHAQVTAGGVETEEFRGDTLESRLAPGVFAAGEVLNVDGDCGGYNLQWAWSSGRLAGQLGAGGVGE